MNENLTIYKKCKKCGSVRNIEEAKECPICSSSKSWGLRKRKMNYPHMQRRTIEKVGKNLTRFLQKNIIKDNET
jgi:hypothetical protein